MHPLIFHNNGDIALTNPGRVYFFRMRHALLANDELKGLYRRPQALDIVCCWNQPEQSVVGAGLDHLGIDYVVLGRDVRPWENFSKINLVLDYLRNRSRADYVLHLDASDVLLAGDPAEVLNRFQEHFTADIVFNAERNSFPGSRQFGRYYQPDEPFSVLSEERIAAIEAFERSTYPGPPFFFNSGCFIGKREAVIELFTTAQDLKGFIPEEPWTTCDQPPLRELHRRFFPRIQMDAKEVIFQSLFMIDYDDVKFAMPHKAGL